MEFLSKLWDGFFKKLSLSKHGFDKVLETLSLPNSISVELFGSIAIELLFFFAQYWYFKRYSKSNFWKHLLLNQIACKKILEIFLDKFLVELLNISLNSMNKLTKIFKNMFQNYFLQNVNRKKYLDFCSARNLVWSLFEAYRLCDYSKSSL